MVEYQAEVEYHKKQDGILRCDIDGSCRFLTFWETIRYYFGGKP